MQVVYIIDEDESVRRDMKKIICSEGMEALPFATAKDFLDYDYETGNACLLTDIKMKGFTGLELQEELEKRGNRIPLIFITA